MAGGLTTGRECARVLGCRPTDLERLLGSSSLALRGGTTPLPPSSLLDRRSPPPIMRQLDDRSHLRLHFRPKGADIDRPTGYIKKKLRRKLRRLLKLRKG